MAKIGEYKLLVANFGAVYMGNTYHCPERRTERRNGRAIGADPSLVQKAIK